VKEHARTGTGPVDGLRGLAILLVFGYHTWLFSWYTPPPPFDVLARTGYLGVDLFFLISGFCLFFPYARHALEAGAQQTVRTFAHRRFIKIVPSYLLALGVTLAVALPVYMKASESVQPLAQHLFFIENFFDDHFGPVNSVFWSLGIEVQFYLIFPLLAALFAPRPVLAATAMVVAALAYRYGFAGCCLDHELVMRQLPAFLDVFAFGMLAAYAFVYARKHFAAWIVERQFALTLLALILVVVVFELLVSANAVQYDLNGREHWNLAGRTALGGVIAGLLVASCFAQRWWRFLIGNPVLVFLSVVSYNLYLWHTLIELWLLHHHLPPSSLPSTHDDDAWKPWFIALSILLCVGISAAITYFIERPLLATVRPHSFAFNWRALLPKSKLPAAAPETRT
jgi:peptidoglycan/LPS O-acetylase OafA/YrhL